jgi:hypothetical protein
VIAADSYSAAFGGPHPNAHLYRFRRDELLSFSKPGFSVYGANPLFTDTSARTPRFESATQPPFKDPSLAP